MMYAQIDVTGTPIDVHSGGYGGVIENPANALAQIIAALKGPDGRIRIPGFYDDVVPLTEAERAAFADLPFDEEAFRDARACRRWSGRPGSPSSSARAPARRSTSTASGAGSRAMAPRRSSRRTPTPR